MPTFSYTALSDDGARKRGFIEAESQARAFALLAEQGLTPTALASVGRGGMFSRAASGARSGPGVTGGLLTSLRSLLPGASLKLDESFFYLGLLLQSGSSLAEALEMMGRMAGGRPGRIWMSVRDKVETGESFSQALSLHPRAFPRVYVGMIKVAENVGRLGPVLEQIASYEERRKEVSDKLTTALVYPCVILLVGMGAVYFLLSQVLPKIANIFTSANADLPLGTQIMLTVGATLEGLGPAVLIPPFALVGGFFLAYNRVERFKRRVDKLLWKIPLVRKTMLARFSSMLGFQLQAGIPLVQALQSSSAAVGSAHFRKIIASAETEVSAGQPLDKVLARTGAFPDIYVLTLTTGQKSGKLGLFLSRTAQILEKEADAIVKRVLALAEPVLILLVGLVVGFIVLAIMGPIFDLTTLVN